MNDLKIFDKIKGDQVSESTENNSPILSTYFDSAKEIIQKLNAVSPSMCLAKWYNVSIHLTTGRTHSCYHPPSHQIPLTEIEQNPAALHNTKFKIEQRKKMLNGVRPDECSYCWKAEDTNNLNINFLSDRAYRSADIYTPELLNEAITSDPSFNFRPRYVEVNFNQSCNFKCSYCSPHLSTSWKKEIDTHGPLHLVNTTHNDISGLEKIGLMPDPEKSKIYVDAFWKWWPEAYNALKYFRMTGGEPLLDQNTFRIFEYVTNHPKSDLQLAITSNCNPPEKMWQRFINNLQNMEQINSYDHFMLFCSLDSWGEHAEYIRSGMNFKQLEKNIHHFLQATDKTSLTFIATINNLSIVNLKTYLENILLLRRKYSVHRQKIWLDTPILHAPAWMNLQTLPPSYHRLIQECIDFVESNLETLETRFQGFKDFELDRFKRVFSFAQQPINNDELLKNRANFSLYFNQIDQRRNTDIKKVFPEMSTFFDLCEQSLEQYQKENSRA